MSRQSDHSEGNGDSRISSLQNSPRKTPELGSAGPCGDFCTGDKTPECLIFMVKDEPSSDEADADDQESYNLKDEYLQRLNLIRQKLATIDIANYKSYYERCCGYDSPYTSGCKIIEILDDECAKNENKSPRRSINDLTTTQPCSTGNDKIPVDSTKENIPSKDDNIAISSRENTKNDNTSNINLAKTPTNLEDANMNYSYTSKGLNGTSNLIQENNETTITNTSQHEELQTIFMYRNPNDAEFSSTELFDLNYNPPKKKYCTRERTPKMIMSEGSMSLPYHIRIGLHNDILRANDPVQFKRNKTQTVVPEAKKINTKILKSADISDNTQQKLNTEDDQNKTKETEDKNDKMDDESQGDDDKIVHVFPVVQVDCFGEGNPNLVDNKSVDDINVTTEKEELQSPTHSAETEQDYRVFYFETLEQSRSSASGKSNKTVISETTITTDSPSRKPKRRKLLLRSARNKVKPVDTMTLWEEIRTMEALNKKKEESSSSLESFFKDVVLSEKKQSHRVNLVSVGSLDIPRKTKPLLRFPSITRITQFCISLFKRKSQTIIDETKADDETTVKKSILKSSLKKKTRKSKKDNFSEQTAAHMLLNVRKKQDLAVDPPLPVDGLYESYSECSEVLETDDSYYEGNCPICFCF